MQLVRNFRQFILENFSKFLYNFIKNIFENISQIFNTNWNTLEMLRKFTSFLEFFMCVNSEYSKTSRIFSSTIVSEENL